MNRYRMFCTGAGVFVCLAAVAACSDSSPPGAAGGPPSQGAYAVHNLVSDGYVPADHTDANLKNPWGIVFNGGGSPLAPVWVANNGTNTSTLYDGTGSPVPTAAAPFVFNIPAGMNGAANPTGIVYNGTSDFAISQGTGLGMPASFIFSGEGGTIAAWTTTNLTNAVTVYDTGTGGAVYKGLALANNGSANFLYATDFHNNKIDVFDKNYAKVVPAGGFKDPSLPSGYAPFGIHAVGGQLYVSYAQQKAPDNHDEVDGAGLGYVDLFDAAGRLLKRVVSQGALNAPWGIALAPPDFGAFSGALLIGNFGDGLINAYHPVSGAFLGSLRLAGGAAIRIPGLWGIAFGNGVSGQPVNTLFFAAGINDEADGLYGRIDAAAP